MMKRFLAILAVIAAVLTLRASASIAAPRLDMLGGVVHLTLESGKMLPLEGVEPEKTAWGQETLHYVRTEGDEGPLADGLKSGIYFFGAGGRTVGFVSCEPYGGSAFCYPIFSPDGNALAIDSGTYAVRSFGTYWVFPGKTSFEFVGISTFGSVSTPAWIDNSRLIYNSFEENKPAREAREYKSSVCVFNIQKKEQTVIAAHTATSDYAVEFDYDETDDDAHPAISGDSVRVVRTYVDSPSKWNDFDALKQETLMIKIPAK